MSTPTTPSRLDAHTRTYLSAHAKTLGWLAHLPEGFAMDVMMDLDFDAREAADGIIEFFINEGLVAATSDEILLQLVDVISLRGEEVPWCPQLLWYYICGGDSPRDADIILPQWFERLDGLAALWKPPCRYAPSDVADVKGVVYSLVDSLVAAVRGTALESGMEAYRARLKAKLAEE